MAKKAIIWARVSTDHQNIEAQKQQLINMAYAEGYKHQNIIILDTVGASAVKEDEKFRQAVDELLTYLNSDTDINCVYAWEVSRLARRQSTFHRIKEFLEKNKIQLIIKTPAIRLFNEKGELDQTAQFTLSLLATIATQEMELTKARMARGRKEAQSKGKWSGGNTKMFGYTVDANNYIIVNEEEAQTVREVFDLYLHKNMSAGAIYNHMVTFGKFEDTCKFAPSRVKKVTNILTCRAYCGKPKRYNGTETSQNKYPAIVDEATVNAAIAKVEERMKAQKTRTKYVLYAKGLLRGESGYMFTSCMSNCCYRSQLCKEDGRLSINAVDSIVWHAAAHFHDKYAQFDAEQHRENYTKAIETKKRMITECKAVISEAESKNERIEEMYVDGRWTKEKYSQKTAENDRVIAAKRLEVTRLENEIVEMTRKLEAIPTVGVPSGLAMPDLFGNTYAAITDDTMRKVIIDNAIERIDVERTARTTYILRVHGKQYKSTLVYELAMHGHWPKITQFLSEKYTRDVTKIYQKRFTLKRYEK